MTAVAERGQWPQMLKEFSRRNAGRVTRLEVDDPELGAQWAEMELHFRGAAFEPRHGRVELMLSDGGPLEHLTHSIEAVTQLDVSRTADGRDAVLRLAYPGGQTLLRLDAAAAG
ncbi:DUF5335 family protein [Longimicrobium sp.]|uniref:DUF5335 family protein n=1 Tax=Longimicrobium sp. TaxID=2029185 RepID=UPI002B873FB2|nr:DUF5335 family protein [Longimicrobium sp.]HSU15641.1 DUF5335 family protein [Longimicrobium sp.]